MTNIALPPELIQSLSKQPDLDIEAFINTHTENNVPTSIRLNPYKKAIESHNNAIPWCTDAFYLDERPSFTLDPLFHAGAYYVQEAASMFISHIFAQLSFSSPQKTILDLCAAPGGKSTLLASLINKDDILLSNEIIKTRIPPLIDNLNKWGQLNTFVSNNDPKDFKRLPNFFDLVLVDAPCSGSGMFRKDPKTICEWSPSNVNLCQGRQKRILEDIIPSIKSGGYLIYSTCSYSSEENEDILDWLLDSFDLSSINIQHDPSWGITETTSPKHKIQGLRFYPHKTKSEGFFVACLQKKNIETEHYKKNTSPLNTLQQKTTELLNPWLNCTNDNISFFSKDEWIYAIPTAIKQVVETLANKLYLKKAGICMGKMIHQELIPHHQLALSSNINTNIPKIELSFDDAINYLKLNPVNLSTDSTKGWNTVCYQNLRLGWIKILPNRTNNYYPKELRILH